MSITNRNIISLATLFVLCSGCSSNGGVEPTPQSRSTITSSITDNTVVSTGSSLSITIDTKSLQVGEVITFHYATAEGSNIAVTKNNEALTPNTNYTHVATKAYELIVLTVTPQQVGAQELTLFVTNTASTVSKKITFKAENDLAVILDSPLPERVAVGANFAVKLQVTGGSSKQYYITASDYLIFGKKATIIDNLSSVDLMALKSGHRPIKFKVCDLSDSLTIESRSEFIFDLNCYNDSTSLTAVVPEKLNYYEETPITVEYRLPNLPSEKGYKVSLHAFIMLNGLELLISDNVIKTLAPGQHFISDNLILKNYLMGPMDIYIRAAYQSLDENSDIENVTSVAYPATVVKSTFTYTASPYEEKQKCGVPFEVSVSASRDNYSGDFDLHIFPNPGIVVKVNGVTVSKDTPIKVKTNEATKLIISSAKPGSNLVFLQYKSNGDTGQQFIEFSNPVTITAKVDPAETATVTGLGEYYARLNNQQQKLNLVVTPIAGWRVHLSSVELTGNVPDASTEVLIEMTKDSYPFSLSATPGGTAKDNRIGIDPEFSEKITLTASPNQGYNFIGWYDKRDNVLLSDAAVYVYTMPSYAVSIEARFSQKKFINITTAPEDGEVYLENDISDFKTKGDGTYEVGTFMTLSARNLEPFPPYKPIVNKEKAYRVEWYSNGVKVGNDRELTVKVSEEQTHYVAKYYAVLCLVRLNIIKDHRSGVLNPNAGNWGEAHISETVNGITNAQTAMIPYGSIFSITGAPYVADHKRISGYWHNGVYGGGNDEKESFRTELDNVVDVHYGYDLYAPRIGVNGIRVKDIYYRSASGDTMAAYGEEMTVTAVMNSGYTFVNWHDNDTNQVLTTNISYTFITYGKRDFYCNTK